MVDDNSSNDIKANRAELLHRKIDWKHEFKNEYRGVVALENIPNGSKIITLPVGTFIRSQLEEADVPVSTLDANCRLILRLLREKSLGKDSLFYDYLNDLPSYIPLPVCWTAEERKYLEPTTAQIVLDHDMVRSRYDRFILPVMKAFPQYWNRPVLSYEVYLWAHCVIISRAVGGIFSPDDEEKEGCLVPIIDMANHTFDSVPSAKVVHMPDCTFQLVAVRDIDINEEICITYGDLSNTRALVNYGFVTKSLLPHDHVFLPVTLVESACVAICSNKKKIEYSVPTSQHDPFVLSAPKLVTDDDDDAIKDIISDRMLSFISSYINDDDNESESDDDMVLYEMCLTVLVSAIKLQLDRYHKFDIMKDTDNASASKTIIHGRLAEQLCKNEQSLLEKLVKTLMTALLMQEESDYSSDE